MRGVSETVQGDELRLMPQNVEGGKVTAEWHSKASYPPQVSIVVVSYTIERISEMISLIESIEQENHNDLELVLVVERDSDLFNMVLAHLRNSSLRIQAIFSDKRIGISGARNLGTEHCSSGIVSFVDDDARLSKGWKRTLINDFENNSQILGVVGRVDPSFERQEDTWFPKAFYWMIGCSGWTSWASKRLTRFGWGANMSFKSDVFTKFQFEEGFSEGAGKSGKIGPVGDDTDFCFRITAKGGRLLFDPNLLVHHKVYSYRVSPQFTRRYAFWQGYTEGRFQHRLRAFDSRKSQQTRYVGLLLGSLIPDIFSKISSGNRMWRSELALLIDSTIFMGLGFVSFYSERMLSVCSNLL